MPDHNHRLTTSPSNPLIFTLCQHFSPPTPLPAIQPTAGTQTLVARFPFRCLACDMGFRLSSQDLVLDAYNGMISDQAGRLLIAAEREGTEREGRYDAEMVAEGEHRIRCWRLQRATEVTGIWKGFLERWNGGTSYEAGAATELQLRLTLDGEGGYVVEGAPTIS